MSVCMACVDVSGCLSCPDWTFFPSVQLSGGGSGLDTLYLSFFWLLKGICIVSGLGLYEESHLEVPAKVFFLK